MVINPLRMKAVRQLIQCASYTIIKRPISYKSSISLENLYPNSSLKLTTPSFNADPNDKFSGFIPLNKLEVTYSASSGPGGQNVNKVHTKVDMRFKPSEADWLHPDVRAKLLEIYGSKVSKEGYLIIRSDTTRSQQLNLADCMQKLRNMIRAATDTNRKPSQESEEMARQRHLKASRLRVAIKREDAMKRAMRQSPTVVDL